MKKAISIDKDGELTRKELNDFVEIFDTIMDKAFKDVKIKGEEAKKES